MKFRLRKRQQPPGNAKRKSLHLPPADNPDPAFSPDPRSHPFHYLTNHEWALPLAPGHPSLQSPRRRRRRAATGSRRAKPLLNDSNQSDATESEFEIIQPPSSPVSTNSITSATNNKAGKPAGGTVLVQSGRRVSPPPSRYPPQPPTSMLVQPTSLAKEDVKPVKRFGFLTKKISVKQSSSSSKVREESRTILIKPQGRRSEENGPTHSSRQVENPALQRHKSAPGPPRTAQSNLITALGKGGSRSTEGTGAVPSTFAAITHQQDAALNGRSALDKVDELDESAIFGARLHHDGPYEVANRAVTEAGFTSKSRMPLGLDYGRLHQFHERTMKAVGHVYMPPEVPPGVPLNLKPGQLLPRNFRRQAGKPPRLRNNMVSPLPVEDEVDEVASSPGHQAFVVPPRHANLNEIPFHKGQVGAPRKPRPPRRPVQDNPLDGPPIDTTAIGLAMLAFIEDDDTPLPSAVAQQGHEDDEECEYDPYAPENLAQPSPTVNPSLPTPEDLAESPPPAYAEESKPQGDTISVMEFPAEASAEESDDLAVEDMPHSRSPSTSSLKDFAFRSLHGASEETLVQREDAEGVVQPPDPESHRSEAHSPEVQEDLLEKSRVKALEDEGMKDEVDATSSVVGMGLNEMDSTLQQPSVTTSNEPHSLEAQVPKHKLAEQFEKQLPPYPTGSPPPQDHHDQRLDPSSSTMPSIAVDESPPIVVQSPGASEEWKNPAQGNDLSRSASVWSTTTSQQSHCSTRVNDGHTPVPDTVSTASSSKLAPPGMMSRQSNTAKANTLEPLSTSLISRRDPVFNADSLTRYPLPKPSLVAGTSSIPSPTSSQDKKLYVIPAQRSRRNSTASSSAHSSILHTIHEEGSDVPPVPNLQRRQSSIRRREMLARIQVGQVYPKDLQGGGPAMQRSTTQLAPQYQPPPYTEDPQPSRTPSSERRRREHKQASADHQERQPPMPTFDVRLTNAGYDPRLPPQERIRNDRRSSGSTHSSRSTSTSSRSGHSSSSTSAHTTPERDPRVAASGDQRAQFAAYPFRDGDAAEEKRTQPQLSLAPQPPSESARRVVFDDRRAMRAINALSGVPEMEESRSSSSKQRQSYQQPYSDQYQGYHQQYEQAHNMQQGETHPHPHPQQQLQRPPQQYPQYPHQPAEQYAQQQLYQYLQADNVQDIRRRSSAHIAEPSSRSESVRPPRISGPLQPQQYSSGHVAEPSSRPESARPPRDPHLLQPYPQQYPIQDNASSKPRSTNTSLTTSSTMPRSHAHLPKRLVMPAPLQGQITKSERVFNEVFDVVRPAPTPRSKGRDRSSMMAMPRPGVQPTRTRAREPSPGNLVPPLLGNGQDVDPSVSAGRKLKKRSSQVPPPPPRRPSPAKAMDFPHPTTASERGASYSSKPPSTAKKVLSKKRTNV